MDKRILLDEKLKCMSIITNMSVSEYLQMVEKAYQTEEGFLGKGKL
ncbi:hypothetical protein [Petralouisia muris]|nr:hypothetical protein [Petralouisia muris]